MFGSGPATAKPRVLIFIVAYNAESTIERVLRRIPTDLLAFDTEILIIDDASQDSTFEASETVRRAGDLPFKLTVLVNPVNQGYGGNQKLGFLYAIEHGFDVVVLLHGDGQYAPESLPELLAPLLRGEADVVLGSRMMRPFQALKGGMPLYKYIGNKILTTYQNRVLGTQLSEFHSGYRVYRTETLRQIPFQMNTPDFHFDTEIIIQLLRFGAKIVEVPIPTYYGDEICYVNGFSYALNVVRASTAAALQRFNLVYRRNFDVGADSRRNVYYLPKLDYPSTHTEALKELAPGQTVVDIGCGAGYFAAHIRARGCRVIGIDQFEPLNRAEFDEFIVCDLDTAEFPSRLDDADVLLMLDVIEHLRSPEAFAVALHAATTSTRQVKIVVTTGNVGFIVPRLMLLAGQFNYGKRGILDLTHTRLFTFASLRRLFQESGFEIGEVRGIPAPIPLVVSHRLLARLLVALNQAMIRIAPALFSYQIYMVVRPLPSLSRVLDASRSHTAERAEALTTSHHVPDLIDGRQHRPDEPDARAARS
jgi:glycosyltransferase involved in cell wall biosynthesis